MVDEDSRDSRLTAQEEMERATKGTLDRLHREMHKRFARLHGIDAKFGSLLHVQGL